MDDALKTIKEFVWDILGYLIPGLLSIIIFNFIVLPSISDTTTFVFNWNKFENYLILIISYILGYIIYSLSRYKMNCQDFVIDIFTSLNNLILQSDFKYLSDNRVSKYIIKLLQKRRSDYWKKNIENKASFKSAKNFLITQKYSEVDNMEFNEVRNILMSRNPEMDQKVYTFMFRAALFDHISTVFYIVFILFLIQNLMNFNFLKTESIHNVLYISVVFLIPLLGNCKRLFYSIAQRLPISNLK